jgi:hypothetical protein
MPCVVDLFKKVSLKSCCCVDIAGSPDINGRIGSWRDRGASQDISVRNHKCQDTVRSSTYSFQSYLTMTGCPVGLFQVGIALASNELLGE